MSKAARRPKARRFSMYLAMAVRARIGRSPIITSSASAASAWTSGAANRTILPPSSLRPARGRTVRSGCCIKSGSRQTLELPHKLDRGVDDGVSLIAMRRVAAILQLAELHMVGTRRDSIDLLKSPVFVILPLNREHGTPYPWQAVFDVPATEVLMQPDVIPAAKREIDVGVIACEPRT